MNKNKDLIIEDEEKNYEVLDEYELLAMRAAELRDTLVEEAYEALTPELMDQYPDYDERIAKVVKRKIKEELYR